MNVLCTEMVAYTLSPCPSLHCKAYLPHITHLHPPLQLLSGPELVVSLHDFRVRNSFINSIIHSKIRIDI